MFRQISPDPAAQRAGRQGGTDGVRQLWSVDLRDTVINGALALATFAYEIESKYLH